MFRKLFHRLLLPYHPWRRVTFTELSEMYLAVLLRTVSIGMVGIFVPVYLLKSGFMLPSILEFYVLFYAFGIFNDLLCGGLIARFGPKHVMRTSFLLQTAFSLMLVELPHLPVPILLLSLVASLASTMYFLPYHVGFSKIKHPKHGGKELGFLQVMERVGGVVGPLIGGALATYVNPRATFLAAAGAMFIAAIILMLSPEPVQTHQKLNFRGLAIKKELSTYVSYVGFTVENSVSLYLWPVFLAAVVFSYDAYLKIGTVSSVSVLAAVLVVIPLGRMLDKQKGKKMIQLGTAINALIHLVRPFISTLGGAVGLSALNEPITSVYRMAYLKGFYDSADDHPGYRIAYVTINEVVGDMARVVLWGLLLVLSLFVSASLVCAAGFLVGAAASLLIRAERFAALR